jgi:acetyl esterase|tara:strand:+ start:59524 stop:60489 length:966 start_codon:yes stop_codon:yes gene_type:complete
VFDSHYVDPEVRPILDMLAAQFGDYSELNLEDIRALYNRNGPLMAAPVPEGCVDERRVIPGPGGDIECRIFRPWDSKGNLPIIVHYLGGTFVATSLDHLGPPPTAMAMQVGCLVVVPLHRVPPEHPFPAAYDDALAVYRWLTQHAGQWGGDPQRIILHGESSGATLAASVCLEAREAGVRQPLMQVLAEPLLDHEAETPSINEFRYMLAKRDIRFGSRMYFGDDRPPRRASPLRAETLAGVAPAYVITAGLDPLRDEGIAYVARLRSEGVPVTHRHHDGQIHGFFSMFPQILQARIAFEEVCAVMRFAFAGGLNGAHAKGS